MVKKGYLLGTKRKQSDGHVYTLKAVLKTDRAVVLFKSQIKDRWKNIHVSTWINSMGQENRLVWVYGRK